MLCVDESEQKNFLGLGGYYTNYDLGVLEEKWHELKKGFSLSSDDEIKWNLPTDHDTRKKLDANGFKTKDLCESAVELISNLDLTILTVIMVDERKKWWDSVIKRRAPRDFYCEALKYLLQRLGEEIGFSPPQGQLALVVADRPTLRPLKSRISNISLARGEKAPSRLYREAMRVGPGEGPKRLGSKSLRGLGFHSGLLFSYAGYNDLLQIADVIIGCVTSWVFDTADNRCKHWLVQQVGKLKGKFRGGASGMFGDGLVLWPLNNDLWLELQRNLGST